MPAVRQWDIFCRVIDNYGDIGVCWRLARQLVAEHGLQVRLWVDDLASLQPLCPETEPAAPAQQLAGVEVRHWTAAFPDTAPADVVIEAFGCDLPENYLAAMAQSARKPVWLNLEYLSAEAWVDGCHAMISPHPRLPLTRYFFFPGFTPATGGLLREHDLATRRDTLQQDPAAFLTTLGLPPTSDDSCTVSLFCYDTAPIGKLLAAWERAHRPVRCLLPTGKALAAAASHFGLPRLAPGDVVQRGHLTLHVLPFLQQQDYDRLLWACDINFVRGEDSFVRAQWAARPLVWQPYLQVEDAHLVKLDAFLDRYTAGLDAAATQTLRGFHQGWNSQGPLDWDALLAHRHALAAHARDWEKGLSAQQDLVSNLVIFCKNRV